MISSERLVRYFFLSCALFALGGCAYFGPGRDAPAPIVLPVVHPDPNAPRAAPLHTQNFSNVDTTSEILGEVQIIFARHEDTFSNIARTYDLGFDEIRQANPKVDAWLPGEQTPIYLPTMFVLPQAPRAGIVVNLPSLRLLHFHRDSETEISGSVTSHPIGIGRESWATPTGTATIIQKTRDPKWHPPASVRAEHAAMGDPLPAVVPAGPDNPLGRFKMRLSMPGYLIHGTNKPAGVGMRVSHGCIRLYPEDIAGLFEQVPLDTQVTIVDQPILAGWRAGQLYLEAHPPLSEDGRDFEAEAAKVIRASLARAGVVDAAVDHAKVAQILRERRGIPFPILAGNASLDHYLRHARIVKNLATQKRLDTTASR